MRLTSHILIVRHAHSLVNEDFRLAQEQADRDIELSSLGHLQAREMGNQLVSFSSRLEKTIRKIHFIVSPYKRTLQTFEHMSECCLKQFKVTHEINPLIAEKGLGKFEGYDLNEISEIFGSEADDFLRDFNDYQSKYDAKPPSRWAKDGFSHDHLGESYRECQIRSEQFLENSLLTKYYQSDLLIVIIGHGRFNTFLEKQMLAISLDDFWNLPIPNNGAFKHIVFHHEKCSFENHGIVFEGFENKNERALEAPSSTPKTTHSIS